jgi:hypothetical protein
MFPGHEPKCNLMQKFWKNFFNLITKTYIQTGAKIFVKIFVISIQDQAFKLGQILKDKDGDFTKNRLSFQYSPVESSSPTELSFPVESFPTSGITRITSCL